MKGVLSLSNISTVVSDQVHTLKFLSQVLLKHPACLITHIRPLLHHLIISTPSINKVHSPVPTQLHTFWPCILLIKKSLIQILLNFDNSPFQLPPLLPSHVVCKSHIVNSHSQDSPHSIS